MQTEPPKADSPRRNRRWFQFSLRSLFIGVTLLAAVSAYLAHKLLELRPDQRLVIACFRVDASKVADLLRHGANVNASFGDEPADETSPLYDPWTDGLGASTWTPLMALANAPELPDPPAAAKRLSLNPDRRRKLEEAISKEAIKKRRDDELTILRILLSHKADINADDGCGMTPLAMAVQSGKGCLISRTRPLAF
jgi:hypothetical protein